MLDNGVIVLLLLLLFVCLFVSVLLAKLIVLLLFCIFEYRINLLREWWGDLYIATLRVHSSRPMWLTL